MTFVLGVPGVKKRGAGVLALKKMPKNKEKIIFQNRDVGICLNSTIEIPGI